MKLYYSHSSSRCSCLLAPYLEPSFHKAHSIMVSFMDGKLKDLLNVSSALVLGVTFLSNPLPSSLVTLPTALTQLNSVS